MTIEKLIAKLKEQRNKIDFTIETLEAELRSSSHREKSKAILKSVNNHQPKAKPLHWTLRPENAAKVKRWKKAIKAGQIKG